MATCEGDSDDCMRIATVTRDTSDGWLARSHFCEPCAEAYDRYIENFDPPDADGEDLFRDYRAEDRDRMDEARRLK